MLDLFILLTSNLSSMRIGAISKSSYLQIAAHASEMSVTLSNYEERHRCLTLDPPPLRYLNF